MQKIAIAIHGGAGEDSPYIKENEQNYKNGLQEAVRHGHAILAKGGTALDAVEETVKVLEDNPFFNAGRGAALNSAGEVEMDAAIMEGHTLKAGAVSLIRGVKNPISLARIIMNTTKHVYIAGKGAVSLADLNHLEKRPVDYFITPHQLDLLREENDRESRGTVGAVALDLFGNLAAATSTGGITNSHPGRIGDSCIIGAGCYANDHFAGSCTGDGELIITSVVAHTVSMLTELAGMSIQQACDAVIQNVEKPIRGDVGMISLNHQGEFGISFNSQRMHRAWIGENGTEHIFVYHK